MYSLTHSCLTLCNPLDYSPASFSIHGIFQARLSKELPFPPPGDHHYPGIKPMYLISPALPTDSLLLSHQGSPAYIYMFFFQNKDCEP